MAVAFVKATKQWKSAALSTTFAITYTAGNTILLAMSYEGSGTVRTVSVSGSVNGSYTESGTVVTDGSHFVNTRLFYVTNASGTGETITMTWNSATAVATVALEFSGVDNASPIGGTASGLETTAGDILSGSLSASGNTDDAVVAAAGNYYVGTFSVGSTNPTGMAIPTNGAETSGGTGFGNVGTCYTILAGTYSGATSMAMSGTTYGAIKAVVLTSGGAAAPSGQPYDSRTSQVPGMGKGGSLVGRGGGRVFGQTNLQRAA